MKSIPTLKKLIVQLGNYDSNVFSETVENGKASEKGKVRFMPRGLLIYPPRWKMNNI